MGRGLQQEGVVLAISEVEGPVRYKELVPEMLGRARNLAGLSKIGFVKALQKELVFTDERGLTRATLWAYETGRSMAPSSVLLAAAKIAGVPVDELMGGQSMAYQIRDIMQRLSELEERGRRKPTKTTR